ncbi:FAD-dependent oxidoreductase [Candidatus Margulisiibacteriota bacterium]
MYDIIIIGAGPAGITAAVYAARQKRNVLILTENIGGQAATSGDIENYTGFQFIPGIELAQIFEEHVRKYTGDTVTIKEQEPAQEIKKPDDYFQVTTLKETYQTKTVIIASGKKSRELGVPGEKEFKNKGVTYCATCDGPVFTGKDVAVIGGGNSALDAALQLINIANKIYLININDNLMGDQIMIDKINEAPGVQVMNNTETKEIKGEIFVNSIVVDQAGQEQTIDLQGIFVEAGLIPNSSLGIDVKKNKMGEIIVSSTNCTSIPGVFAAGDVTDVPAKQIIVAAGDGAKACLSAIKYLNQLREGICNPMSKWKCLVCEYIYDPKQNNNVAFADLPEDWACPECGVGKDQFEELIQ